MDHAHPLGKRGRVTVEQGEQGSVLLRSTDLSVPVTLESDEALDLLQWLFERRDGLILETPTGRLSEQEPRSPPEANRTG